jgi:hypothetical protein
MISSFRCVGACLRARPSSRGRLSIVKRVTHVGACLVRAPLRVGGSESERGARTPLHGSRGRLIEWRLARVEVFVEAATVVRKQMLNTLRVGRRDNQPRVMKLVQPINDLRINICRSIRVLLARQRDDYPGVVVAMRRQSYGPSSPAISIRAHSAHRFTPVAASIVSAMLAPPTRAAVSRK